MRPIKFRAWDKRHKKMGWVKRMIGEYGIWPKWVDISFGSNYFRSVDVWDKKHAVLMQYTGFNDVNGVEIYEGDILKLVAMESEDNAHWHEEDGNHQVYWDATEGRFSVNGLPMGWYGSREVVGNVHESPELLEAE